MNKICAVIGVGAGVGLAVAKRFGQEGYQVAIVARRLEALQDYENQLSQVGVKAKGFSADVSNTTSLVQTFEQIQQTIGAPDVLVYNAAVMVQTDPLTVSAEELVQEFKVDVVGAITSIQQVVPAMKAQGGGTILLTGGALAFDEYSFPPYLPLALGKAGIRKLAFTYTNALKNDNIHVATVTICGTVEPGTHFDPDKIADMYLRLHQQQPSEWKTEFVYK